MEERFKAAIDRAKEILEQYKEIGWAGAFGASTIQQQIDQYNDGDRSESLLESIESIE